MTADSHDPTALMGALADELALAIGTVLGSSGVAAEIDEPVDVAWLVDGTSAGDAAATLTLGFARQEAATLAKLALASEREPEEDAILGVLREFVSQAFGALALAPAAKGLTFTPGAAAAGQAPAGSPASATFRLTLGDTFRPKVRIWSDRGKAGAQAVAPGPPVVRETAPVAPLNLPASRESTYPNLDVVLDIDLPFSVRFGETEMTVDALTRLGPGSVIDLGRSPEDPVDVLVNGRMVARGEVVVVGGCYGVRITEVVSAADRLRTMGA
jgi:flagellar motor switch protein FliN/FliY